MSGHSKWATTKHRKAAQDSKRSAMFSKLSRIITVAARQGNDPNPDNNASLAAAIAKAKGYSMPKDKIQMAIDKAFGTGADAATWDEVTYEGYGPAGIGLYVECLTDNHNRTAADVRAAFNHSGGNMGASGSVSYQFVRKGKITVDKEVCDDEDTLMMAVAEAGGDDYEDAGDEWIVWTDPSDVMGVKKGMDDQGVEVKGAETIFTPANPTPVSVEDAKKVMRLVDRLEDLDDVQNVYTTMEITDEVAAALEADEE